MGTQAPAPERRGGDPRGNNIHGRAASLDTTSSMNTAETADTGGHTQSSVDTDPCPFLGHPTYAPVRELVRTSLGLLYLARHRATGERFVVKLLERGPTISSRHVERELLTHRACHGHPHVAQLVEVFLLDRFLAIVIEHVPGGDLLELVESRRGLPEPLCAALFRQLTLAVAHLHSLGAGAREMRLDNKLLAEAPDGAPLLKLADFAYSKSEHVNSDPAAALGSLHFTAPEVLSGAAPAGGAAAARADAWALGVALYKMASGVYPFQRPEDGAAGRAQHAVAAVLGRVARAEYAFADGMSPGLRDLVARLLVVAPERRATLGCIQAHPWWLAGAPPGLAAAAAAAARPDGHPQPECELRALVAAAAAPVRSRDGEVDDIDDILDEEQADELFDELSLLK